VLRDSRFALAAPPLNPLRLRTPVQPHVNGVPLQGRTAQFEAQGISAAETGHRTKCSEIYDFGGEPVDLTVAWDSASPRLGCVGSIKYVSAPHSAQFILNATERLNVG